MLDQRTWIASRVMFYGTAIALMLLLTACATQRYGRATPLAPSERRSLTCEQIGLEIEKTEFFVADIQRQRSETSGAHVLGFLGDFGIGNVMEGNAAEASGEDRLRQLRALHSEKRCPSAAHLKETPAGPPENLTDMQKTYNAPPQRSLNGLWAGTERPESGSCKFSGIAGGKIASIHFELIVREPEISGRVTKAHHSYKSLVNVDASIRGIVSESGEFNLHFGASELGAEIVLQGRLSNESNRASGKWSTPNCQGTLSLTRKSPY